MTKEELIADLEDILMLQKGSLKENDELKTYEDWDSMAMLSVMAIFDSKIKKNVSTDQIRALKTPKDICNLAGL